MSKNRNLAGRVRLSRRAEWASGQPISRLLSQALTQPDLISLAAGFVDGHTLPEGATREALNELLADPDQARAALQYGTTQGYPPLREMICQRYQDAERGHGLDPHVTADQVIMTAGSNQMLHLVSDTLLDPGDIVLCSAPSYFVYLGTLANLGARSYGVESDIDGMIPAALEHRLEQLQTEEELARVKAIYVTSYFDNPCSISLERQRRAQIVEIAERWSHHGRIHVIEDSAYRELRYSGEDVPSVRAFDESQRTVIFVGTFSKSFAPGIRVGFGILPDELVAPICEQKGNFDFGSSNINQYLMYRVLEMGLFDRHVIGIRQSYKVKLDAMLQAADEFLGPLPGVDWIVPTGGLYIWLSLPEGMSAGPSGALFPKALESGVLYVPGEYAFPTHGPCAKNTIRLTFGVQTPANIRRGMQSLGRAIESLV